MCMHLTFDVMSSSERSGNVGAQGAACYFHWGDECAPSSDAKCAFGQAVSAKVSWGLFLGCCGFSTCPSFAHKYELGHGFLMTPPRLPHDSPMTPP